MASARDIIPIVLAGAAGALGGRPAAASIQNAAQTSRQMRLDKEMGARRDQLMSESARRLQLAEESADRANRQFTLSMDRQKLQLEREKKTAEEVAKAKANFNLARDAWAKANPEAFENPQYAIMYDLVKDNPDHFKDLALAWAEESGRKNLTEAQLSAQQLGPGQRLSIKLSDGSTFSAVGPSGTGKAGGIPVYKLENTIFKGQEAYKEAVKNARMELAEFKDETNRILEADDGTTKGTRAANLRLEQQQQMERDLQDLINNPQREWRIWREQLAGLGLNDEGMDNMYGVFVETKKAEARAREEEMSARMALSPSEQELLERNSPEARARAEREAAGLPVAEDAPAPPAQVTPDQVAMPTAREIVGAVDEKTKEWVDNARKFYGIRLPWDPPEGTY
jgi:hypothetical protein